MTGFDWTGQQDFSAGAFPLQERVPANAVEDCVNGLIDDDGSIFKRGGGSYKGTANPGSILSLFDVRLLAGQRTVMLGANALYALAADDATPALIAGSLTGLSVCRAATVAGMMAIPRSNVGGTLQGPLVFGGSRGFASYATGSIVVTEGSKTVTGSGTAFGTAGVDRGGLLSVVVAAPGFLNGAYTGIVDSVDSGTQITLVQPWAGPSGTIASSNWSLKATAAVQLDAISGRESAAGYVAGVAGRLLFAMGNVIAFTAAGLPLGFDSTDFHVVPDGTVNGLQGLGTDALVFTTEGIWRIGNLAYNLTDALGNVQQTLSSVTDGVILWGDPGIAAVDGAVLVPAVDDLYTVGAGGVQRFHAPGMRKQWRAYVKAGYTLGNAAVHRGRYFLPILDAAGATFEDLLVMRLDSGAWTRWSGQSAGVSFAQRGAVGGAPPKLLAAKGTRIIDASGCFEPGAANKQDADGSTFNLQVTTRTTQRKTSKDLLRKVRVRAELDDAASDNPTIAAEVATGRPGSAFTTLTGSMAENDGQTAFTWGGDRGVNFRGEEFRVRLTSSGPSSNLTLRSVEQAFRPSGRQ